MDDTLFARGAEVEISSDDAGFRGSWYSGTVVRPPNKNRRTVVVEYNSLMADENGTKPLQETVDSTQLRPLPPREPASRGFELGEEVDAFYNDGWWEGVVMEVPAAGGSDKYAVFFRGSREQLQFRRDELRLHREWVDGNWVPPAEKEIVLVKSKDQSSKEVAMGDFSEGALVEVSSDEDGFQFAWFAATIVSAIGKEKFLIEYKSLRTEDDKEFLREEVDNLHIRPYPPETVVVDSFSLHEEVDAMYNDGWWVGVVSKVLVGPSYLVYFRSTDEEMEFGHFDLRPHQDWIDGKWIAASKGLNL